LTIVCFLPISSTQTANPSGYDQVLL